nr:hypothetical protein [uncultured Flavobacterium sp.]
MKNMLILFLLMFLDCNSQNKKHCIDKKIKLECLSDIDKLISSKYICDYSFNTFGKFRLSGCKVLFSDENYKVIYDQRKTRILIDKKLNLKYAIVSITPDFKTIATFPKSLYILNDKLMPIFSITKFSNDKFHTYRFKYDKGSLKKEIAIDKESKNINVDKLSYKEIISLVSKMKTKFTYKSDKGDFDEYFNDEPLWSEVYK